MARGRQHGYVLNTGQEPLDVTQTMVTPFSIAAGMYQLDFRETMREQRSRR